MPTPLYTLAALCLIGFPSGGAILDDFFGTTNPATATVSHLNIDDSSLTAGAEHACALVASPAQSRIGALVSCWGSNERGQLELVPADLFVQIAAGAYFTCGVTETMALKCWGSVPQLLRLHPHADVKFIQASVGDGFVCGITSGRGVRCFGDDSHGPITTAPSDASYLQVSCAAHACCALRSNGSAVCWGWGSASLLAQAPAATQFLQLSVGVGGTACGITVDSDLRCWGTIVRRAPPVQKTAGQELAATARRRLGLDGPQRRLSEKQGGAHGDGPAYYDRPGPYTQVSVSQSFVCGLRVDGSPDCFGDTARTWASGAQIATYGPDGAVVSRQRKGPPPAVAVVVEISSHHDNVCALFMRSVDSSEPEVDCWDATGAMQAPPGLRPAIMS